MLTPDQIKPFLLHEDRHIREAASAYFSESWSPDPGLIPMVLDACERHGPRENLELLTDSCKLAMTGPALDRALGQFADVDDKDVIDRLNRLVAQMPGALVAGREGAIADHPRLSPETKDRVRRRGELAARGGAEGWAELQDLARRADAPASEEEFDFAYADDLIDALAARDVPDDDQLCELLRTIEPDVSWLEILLIELAGKRRIAGAVPILVDKLRLDGDSVLESASEALAKIGDVEGVRRIRAAYPTASGDFKIYALGPLAQIKHEEAESAIFELLDIERDRTFRTILCDGLCQLFSARGIEVVRREVAAGYDRTFCHLEEDVVAVADVLGVQFPELEDWRRKRAEEEVRFAQMTRLWEGELAQARLPKAPPVELPPRYAELPAPRVAPATVRKTGAKVGRNDPCPCGSGKKYKKCCSKGD